MNGLHLAFFGNVTRDAGKGSSRNDASENARITVAVNTHTGGERRETEYIAVNLYGNRMSHREYQRQDGGCGCEPHLQARDFRIHHRAPEGWRPRHRTRNRRTSRHTRRTWTEATPSPRRPTWAPRPDRRTKALHPPKKRGSETEAAAVVDLAGGRTSQRQPAGCSAAPRN